MVLQITDESFERDVLQSDKLVLVDFWAEWCGPCKLIAPLFDTLSEEYSGRVEVAKMDVDNNQETPSNFNIRGIPTFILFKGGKEVRRVVGAQTLNYMQDIINSVL